MQKISPHTITSPSMIIVKVTRDYGYGKIDMYFTMLYGAIYGKMTETKLYVKFKEGTLDGIELKDRNRIRVNHAFLIPRKNNGVKLMITDFELIDQDDYSENSERAKNFLEGGEYL